MYSTVPRSLSPPRASPVATRRVEANLTCSEILYDTANYFALTRATCQCSAVDSTTLSLMTTTFHILSIYQSIYLK